MHVAAVLPSHGTPRRPYTSRNFFFLTNSLTKAHTGAQAPKAAQLALFSNKSAEHGGTLKIVFLESLI